MVIFIIQVEDFSFGLVDSERDPPIANLHPFYERVKYLSAIRNPQLVWITLKTRAEI